MALKNLNNLLYGSNRQSASDFGRGDAASLYAGYMRQIEDEEAQERRRQAQQQREIELQQVQALKNQAKSMGDITNNDFDVKTYKAVQTGEDALHNSAQSTLDTLQPIMDGKVAPTAIQNAQKRLDALDDNARAMVDRAAKNSIDYTGKQYVDTVKDVASLLNPVTAGFNIGDKIFRNKIDKKAAEEAGLSKSDYKGLIEDAKKVNRYNQGEHTDSNLTPTEELEYARASMNTLSRGERQLMSEIEEAQKKQYYNDANTSFGAINMGYGYGGSLVQKELDKERRTINSKIENAKNELKNKYGWDDNKIHNFTLMSKRLADAADTEDMQNDFNVDDNDSKVAKIGKGIGALAYNAINAPGEGLTGALSNLESRPEGFGRNTNSWVNMAQNTGDYAQEQVTNQINNPVGKFAYNVLNSVGESATTMAVGGMFGAGEAGVAGQVGRIASLLPFGATAYNSGYNEARERGATDKDAQVYGIAAGLSEMGTEVFSLDHFWDMAKGTKAGKDILINWLAQAGIEGSEEAASDILNRIADTMILGKDGRSKYDIAIDEAMSNGTTREEAKKQFEKNFWLEVGQDALAGAASGGLMGGVGAYAGVQNAKENQRYNNSIQDYYSENDTLENADRYKDNGYQYMADEMDDTTKEGKEAKAKAQELADKQARGEKISAGEKADLQQSLWVAEQSIQDNPLALERRDKYRDYRAEVAQVPSEYRSQSTDISREEGYNRMAEAAKNNDAQTMGEVYQEMKISRSAEARNAADDIFNQFKGMVESKGVSENELLSYKTSQQEAYVAGVKGEELSNLSPQAKEAYNAGQMARISMMKEASIVDNVKQATAQTVDGKMVTLTGTFTDRGVVTQSGEIISDSDIDAKSATAQAYKFADAQEGLIGKNAFLSNLKEGMNLEQYKQGFKYFYDAGSQGLSFENQLKNANNYYVDVLGEDTVRAIYDAGASYAAQIRQNNLSEGIAKAFKVKKGTGTFTDARTEIKRNLDTKIFRLLANVTGLNINLVDSMGEKVNASFDPKTSTVTVSEGSAAQVFHEVLGEFTQFYNSKEYEIMRKALMNVAQDVLGVDEFNKRLNGYRAAYGQAKQSNSAIEMTDEMTNDLLVMVMQSEKGQNAFNKYLSEHSTLEEVKSLKSRISELFAKIKKSIESLFDNTNLNGFQKETFEKGQAQLEELSDMMVKVLDGAIANYQATEDGAELNGDTAFSLDISDERKILDRFGIQWINRYQHVQKQVANTLEDEGFFEKYGSLTNEKSRVVVELSKGRIKESFGPGSLFQNLGRQMKLLKLASVDYIPETIEKGEYTGKDVINRHDKSKPKFDYITHRVTEGDNEYDIRISIKKTQQGNKFHVHMIDIIEKEDSSLTAVHESGQMESMSPHVENISSNDTSVNRNSLTVDSLGNSLSEGQQEYFKDSKVRDENGALRVMYHGTPNGGFNTFNSQLNYFTADKQYAQSYADGRIHGIGTNPEVKQLYLKIEKPFDVRDKKVWDIYYNEFIKGGYSISVHPDTSEAELKAMTRTGLPDWNEAENLYDFLDENDLLGDYDGLILDEGGDLTENGTKNRPISYVTFNSNQAKNIDNFNPTNDVDIRYSLDISDEIKEEHSKQAKNYFGTTYNWKETAYILTDGSRLDFSDKKNGAPAGTRNLDHRDIADAWEDDFDNYSDSLIQFMNEGNVRVSPEADGIDISVLPTKEQFDKIRDFAERVHGEITVDISNEYGDNVLSIDYPKGTRASKIVNDIKEYFDNGATPYVSDLAKFRYSLDISEILYGTDESWKDSFFSESDSEDTIETAPERTYNNAVSILEEGMKALKNQEVDDATVRKIANKLKKELGSKVDTNTFANNLKNAFAYMQSTDHVNYDDMMRIMNEIALPVVDQAVTEKDAEQYQSIIDAFANLKGKRVKLSDSQLKEVKANGTYKEFRTSLLPINISSKATMTLDEAWDELSQATGGILPSDTYELDMPFVLQDVFEASRPTTVNTFGGDREAVAKDVAMRIIEEYLTDSASDKAKSAAAKMKTTNKDYRANVKARYDAKLKEAKEEIKEKYKGRMQDLRADRDSKIAEIKAKNKERNQKARDRRLANHEKEQISKQVNKLIKMIESPTDKNHVPRDMVEPLIEFIDALDFIEPEVKVNKDGKYYVRVYDHKVTFEDGSYKNVFNTITGDTREDVLIKFHELMGKGLGSRAQKSWVDKMQSMRNVLARINEIEGIGEIDEDVIKEFNTSLDEAKKKVSINNANVDALKAINKLLKNINHAISLKNQSYSANAEIDEIAKGTMDTASKLREYRERGKYVEMFKNLLNIDQLTPVTFFELHNANALYDALQDGQDTQQAHLREVASFMQNLKKTLTKDERRAWFGKRAEIKSFRVYDGTISLTVGQIMSLYETYKRETTRGHIAGGFKVDMIERSFGSPIKQSKAYHLTEDDMHAIFSTLTQKQIDFADALQRYMAEKGREWGNETSMKLYGYEKFGEDHYFPIFTDENMTVSNNANVSQARLNSLEHSGMTKALIKDASNPAIIKDILDAYTEHMDTVTSYNGLVPAIKDVMRWLNFKAVSEADEIGFHSWGSVKDSLERMSGKKAVGYVTKLVTDLNGGEQVFKPSNVVSALAGHTKAAAIWGNIRVVAQQPTAYFRAISEIDAKYLFGVTPSQIKEASKKMREQSSIAWWKSQGYYDTSIGRSLKEIITGDISTSQQIKDAGMWAAGKADDITWGILYGAVTNEQKALHPDVTGAQLDELINKRFRDVIDKTQVVDSTLHRSQFMRSQDGFASMQSAFMAEPTKSYNMLYSAMVMDYRDRAMGIDTNGNKRTKRALLGFIISNVVNAFAAQAVIDLLRRNKDDEDPLDTYLKAGLENLVANLNPLKLIPGVKDIVDALESAITGGYHSNSYGNYGMDAITSVLDAGKEWAKLMQGDSDKTVYGMLSITAKPISQITGIGIHNVMRDLVGAYNLLGENVYKNKSERASTYKALMLKDIDEGSETWKDDVDVLFEEGKSIDSIKQIITSNYKADIVEAFESGENVDEQIANIAEIRGYIDEIGEFELDEKWDGDYKAYEESVIRSNWLGEKSEATLLKEERQGYKDTIYNAIDTGHGDWEKAIQQLNESGLKYTSIHSAVSEKYHKQILEDLQNGKNPSATVQRFVAVQAYLSSLNGTSISSKYGGDYRAYELDELEAWLKKQ